VAAQCLSDALIQLLVVKVIAAKLNPAQSPFVLLLFCRLGRE
jgi:hypothetical protein